MILYYPIVWRISYYTWITVIHQTVHWSKYLLDNIKFSHVIKRIIPPVIGLGMIPFIVHPIDKGVEWVLDNTIRVMWKN